MNRLEIPPVGIVGAGPVGLSLAARLASLGIPSVLLEADSHLRKQGSKACLIQGDVLEVLDKFGCAEQIRCRRRHLARRSHLRARQRDPHHHVPAADRLRPIRQHLAIPHRADSADEGGGRSAVPGAMVAPGHRDLAGRRRCAGAGADPRRRSRAALPIPGGLRRGAQRAARPGRGGVDRLQPRRPVPDHRHPGPVASGQGAPFPLRPVVQSGSAAGDPSAAERHLAYRLAAAA